MIRPVGPGIADPGILTALLGEIRSAVLELQTPTRPTRLLSLLQADLPPAADWTNCLVLVSDVPCLGYSDGTNWISAEDGTNL